MAYIIKIVDPNDDTPYYLEWSPIDAAPGTYGMSLEEFTEYYQIMYGLHAMEVQFPQRMERVEKFGTSRRSANNLLDTIGWNRAGKNETCLSVEQILEFYCRQGGEGERPIGISNID